MDEKNNKNRKNKMNRQCNAMWSGFFVRSSFVHGHCFGHGLMPRNRLTSSVPGVCSSATIYTFCLNIKSRCRLMPMQFACCAVRCAQIPLETLTCSAISMFRKHTSIWMISHFCKHLTSIACATHTACCSRYSTCIRILLSFSFSFYFFLLLLLPLHACATFV